MHDQQLAEAMRLFQAGKTAKAERLCELVRRKDPRNAAVLALLGAVHCDRGRAEHGARLLAELVALNPNPAVRFMLGQTLLRLDRAAEALPHLAASHDAAPGDAGVAVALANAQCNHGAALLGRDEVAAAERAFRAALAVQPDLVAAQANLGTALLAAGVIEEAIHALRRATTLQPEAAPLWCNLGNALLRAGRIDDALAAFDTGLAFDPDFAEGHFDRAHALLARGDYAAGFADYEWRHRVPGLAPRHFARPQWDGEPLDGRIILLHAESGFGDTLQFLRYVPMVAANGGRVVLEVPAPLLLLCQSVAGVADVRLAGAALPEFDVQCSLFSLPYAFRTTIESIPAAPYLTADSARSEIWRAQLGPAADRRVGLVWAGGVRPGEIVASRVDRRRSMRLADAAPLGAVPGVEFISLQLGPPAAQLADAPFAIRELLTPAMDFADTAALIANLDLVVSVDTAVAHLAAAMGKPVLLLSRFDACWRWQRNRADNPWYPSLRVFGQDAAGDWAPVVARVAATLAVIAAPPEPFHVAARFRIISDHGEIGAPSTTKMLADMEHNYVYGGEREQEAGGESDCGAASSGRRR